MIDAHDDPTMPTSTFRVWFIGTILVAAEYVDLHRTSSALSALLLINRSTERLSTNSSAFVSLVSPSQSISSSCFFSLLVNCWKQFTTFGYIWSPNPGKFNLNEHMVITIVVGAGFSTPYNIFVRFLVIFLAESGV